MKTYGRTAATGALMITLAAGPATSPLAAAPAVRDGTPTPRACAAYGYGALDSQRDEAVASTGARIMRQAPQVSRIAPRMATRPAPPPAVAGRAAPQASADSSLNEIVVTGSQVRRLPPQPRTRIAPPAGIAPPPPLEIPAPPPAAPPPPPGAGGRFASAPASVEALVIGRTFPGQERYPSATPNAVKRVAQEPVSTFSIDVDTASYSNVRRFLKEGVAPPREAVRVEEMINYFDYAYPAPASRAQPFASFVAVVPSPWAPAKQIVHIGLQGYELPQAQKPPLNLTFLVDVSGSMGPADRLPLARQALNRLVDQLRPQDRVSLVVYAGAAGAVLPPTAGSEKLRIRCAIQALESGGSTAGGEGLALAYRMARQTYRPERVNRVVLMTDGDFNVGVTDNQRLEDFVAAQRKTGVYLSVYGFGRGNYQDLRMQTISQAGNGTAAYVDSLREADKLFEQDFSRQVFPIADDVKIQVEFNPARVRDYRLIGYETRLLNREDFNNDAVDAGEVGAGASVTALYEITPVGAGAAVDPLRYQSEARPASGSAEIAFLRLRYKPKGGAPSRLVERPITDRDRFPSVAAAPVSTRLAVSVAAFGQRLRDDPYMRGDFGWRDIGRLAASAQGADPHGLKGEFLQLVDAAAALRPAGRAAR